MHTDCIDCFLRQADKLLAKYRVQEVVAKDIIARFRCFIDRHQGNNMPIPEASCLMHRLIRRATCVEDPFEKEKQDYNKLLLGLEDGIREIIRNSGDPFQTALRYALAGNIIDFGPSKSFDILKILSVAASKKPATDHSQLLKYELLKASMVLYLGDNAGEIVLDKLFIETIGHPNLYFAVRGRNIINDITMYDAVSVGMTKSAQVISNGYDAPSTLLNRCAKNFREIFNQSGIIISKGQGNLEGLIDIKDKKIFFLLMVKCKVMSERTGVQEGDTVVLFNQLIPSRENKSSG